MIKINKVFLMLLALISGALLPLAFAPFNGFPLSFICITALLFVWLRSTPWQAFWRGFIFGIGFFAVGSSWIYISIHTYGNASSALSGLITAIFIVIMAIFPATLGLFFTWVFKQSRLAIKCLLAFPAMWVVWEWLRSWVFSGFPWLFLGYSQIHSPLRGYAPLIGVYGVSFIVVFIAACLLLLFHHKDIKIKIISVSSIIILFGVGASISTFQWTKPSSKKITVSLVQGNVKQSMKWDMNYLLHILKVYRNETERHWKSDIIVWPEGAIPVVQNQIPSFFNLINSEAEKHHTAVILGTLTTNSKTKQFYNSMVVLGNGKGTYLKRQLVPFGEYTPLKKLFFPLAKKLDIPMSDLSPGPWHQPTLMAAGITIAPYICYEIAYPIKALNSIRDKQLIVTISDDSWFGNSIASPQQLQIAKMRALETGRYLLYANNTGITAIINPNGKVLKMAPTNQQLVLTGTVQPVDGSTPLMRWNYYPMLGIIILCLVLTFMFRRKHHQ